MSWTIRRFPSCSVFFPGAGVHLAVALSDCCRGDSELVNEGRTGGSDTVGVCGSQSEGGPLLFWAIVTLLPRLWVWVSASPEGVADVMQRLRNPFPAFSNEWTVMGFFCFIAPSWVFLFEPSAFSRFASRSDDTHWNICADVVSFTSCKRGLPSF